MRTEQEIYEPTDNINLLIETDHAGTVALAVVDKAVFILNKKNKLTAKKVRYLLEENILSTSQAKFPMTDEWIKMSLMDINCLIIALLNFKMLLLLQFKIYSR